jgi:hypothetical protein
MGRACSAHVQMRNAYKMLIGKREGKKPHGRRRHRWKYNIKMDLRKVVWNGVV